MTSKNLTYVFSIAIMLLCALIVSSSQAKSFSRNDIKKLVLEEAMNSIVPPELALAVAKVESDFNPNALSSAGARGVMQIMPRTGREEFGIVEDELWDARLNIQLGIDYLAQLYRQYGKRWDLALSHYNGGTLRGRGRNARPHSYTRQYVRSVKRWRQRYENQATVWRVAFDDTKLRSVDGWEPARTRVKAALRQSLKRYRRAKEKLTAGNTHQVPYAAQKREWAPWSNKHYPADAFDNNFYKRLNQAKRALDDLGPVPNSRRS